MDDNPYEAPGIEADASDSPLFTWLNALLQVTAAIFLIGMAIVCVIVLLIGIVAFNSGNALRGSAFALCALATGAVTGAAILQFARRRG